MRIKEFVEYLETLHACKDAVEWVRNGGFATAQDAWDACERGDWMLWLLAKQPHKRGDKHHKNIVTAGCKCARLALPYVPAGEDRPRVAI